MINKDELYRVETSESIGESVERQLKVKTTGSGTDWSTVGAEYLEGWVSLESGHLVTYYVDEDGEAWFSEPMSSLGGGTL